MAGRVAFVGREDELSRLVGALGGDARLVLVTGDAGVGKTRFAGEGMARAAAGGMVVAWGECLPLAHALPLLPVISALDGLARLDEGKVLAVGLDAAPGFVRGEVERLLPQLGPGSGPSLGGRDGGWERERLFAGVAELLSAVAAGSAALRAALAAAHGHQPLLAQIRALAESARIPLHTPAAPRHRPTHVPPMGLPGASWRCCSSASGVLAQPRPGSVARRPRRPLGSREGQQQCRARAWDGSLVRKEPTAQALPAEPAATPSRMLVAPRFGLPTCAHLVPFQCRISVLSPVPLAK
jgi:AAA ATPase-like protein